MAGNPSQAAAHHRSRIGGLSRAGVPSDDPRYDQARRDLRAQLLAEHVEKVVAQAPPLTDEQRDRIAAILRGGAA